MSKEKLKVRLRKNKDKKLEVFLDIIDSKIVGKKGKLRLIVETIVKDSRPINDRKVLYKEEFVVGSVYNQFFIDLKNYKYYSYKGTKIEIKMFVEIVIDDAIFFDTTVKKSILKEIGYKPDVSSIPPKQILDPKDNFNFIENVKAIPTDAKIYVFGLSIIGAIVILINMFLGIHDQLVPESQTFFYSHYDSDGEGNSPFINALITSGALGAGIWALMKTQLKRYMKFFFKKGIKYGIKGRKYKVSEIIGGKSIVDLNNIKIRIVAGNLEKGQYTRGSGSNKRTVSFSNPIKGIILYEEKVDFIPKKTDISTYFKGSFDFDLMYRVLYPEQMISSTHGLKLRWEVQLLHDKFIDQELVGSNKDFKFEDFLKG